MEFKRGRPERFIIELQDNQFHIISPETSLKYGFSPGKEFEEEAFFEILKEDAIRRAKDQALRYLEIRPHSRRELFIKLQKKGYLLELINHCLNDLEKVDLINDEKFTRLFIQNELRLRPCGKILLRQKIIQRGIPSEIFEPILEEAFQKYNEEDIASRIADKFLKIHHYLEKERRKEKLTRHLLGKGFSWDIVGEIFKNKNL
jgi:regulatory protein